MQVVAKEGAAVSFTLLNVDQELVKEKPHDMHQVLLLDNSKSSQDDRESLSFHTDCQPKRKIYGNWSSSIARQGMGAGGVASNGKMILKGCSIHKNELRQLMLILVF